jgi:hypothetical protein
MNLLYSRWQGIQADDKDSLIIRTSPEVSDADYPWNSLATDRHSLSRITVRLIWQHMQ